MSCTWYNPELPNPYGRPQCASCNGTQYNVSITNNTLFTLLHMNVSNVPIDLVGDNKSASDVSPSLHPGQIGFLVTNVCEGCTPIDKFVAPTSPMTLNFTDVGNGNPVGISISITPTCQGEVRKTVGGVTYTVRWVVNCNQNSQGVSPQLSLSVTRSPLK